jgi:hypothetical protein
MKHDIGNGVVITASISDEAVAGPDFCHWMRLDVFFVPYA